MHEASMMSDLTRHIDEIAKAEKAVRVLRVSVWLGALCHFSAPHFSGHFRTATLGTIAEGANLDLTLSEDTEDANAQKIILQSIELET